MTTSAPRHRHLTVSYDRRTRRLSIGGIEHYSSKYGGFVAHIDELDRAAAVDLRKALLFVERDQGSDVAHLWVSTVPRSEFDDEPVVTTPVRFELEDGQLALNLYYELDRYQEEEEQTSSATTVLKPLMAASRIRLVSINPDLHYVGPPWPWSARMVPQIRSRNLLEVHNLGLRIAALLQAAGGGALTLESTLDLLRGGQGAALIGQSEGPWLDVKSQHYDLTTLEGKVKLAMSVARFVNAEHGGLVVVGMATKRLAGGGEEIRSINPVPYDRGTLRRYKTAIENHLYPLPDFLTIEMVQVAGGVLVVIHAPPQAEENKPFLVSGAIVDGKADGAFISIVRRRGEDAVPMTAAAVHSWISAGRGLMRLGVQKPSSEPLARDGSLETGLGSQG